MNISRPAVSQAQIFSQQPDIPNVSFNGLEITFFNSAGDDEGTVVVDTEDEATIDLMTQSQYTLLVRAVNDWGASAYVDATVPEYVQRAGKYQCPLRCTQSVIFFKPLLPALIPFNLACESI